MALLRVQQYLVAPVILMILMLNYSTLYNRHAYLKVLNLFLQTPEDSGSNNTTSPDSTSSANKVVYITIVSIIVVAALIAITILLIIVMCSKKYCKSRTEKDLRIKSDSSPVQGASYICRAEKHDHIYDKIYDEETDVHEYVQMFHRDDAEAVNNPVMERHEDYQKMNSVSLLRRYQNEVHHDSKSSVKHAVDGLHVCPTCEVEDQGHGNSNTSK